MLALALAADLERDSLGCSCLGSPFLYAFQPSSKTGLGTCPAKDCVRVAFLMGGPSGGGSGGGRKAPVLPADGGVALGNAPV